MKISLSPLGRDFALYVAIGMAIIVILSMLDEILHLLRSRNYVVVHYNEIKTVDEVAESVTIDATEPNATARKRNAKGHFVKSEGGGPHEPVSVMDTPTE